MSKKKKQGRIWVCMKSSISNFKFYTEKKRVVGHKLSLKKYDPFFRKHVIFNESK